MKRVQNLLRGRFMEGVKGPIEITAPLTTTNSIRSSTNDFTMSEQAIELLFHLILRLVIR